MPIQLSFAHTAALITESLTLRTYYWVTSGHIEQNARNAFEVLFGRPGAAAFGRIELWDGPRLVDEIHRWAPQLLPSLVLLDLCEGAERHRKDRGVFASWFLRGAFHWHLKHRPSDLGHAAEFLRQAIETLGSDKRRQLFYHRTLQRYYGMWLEVIEEQPQLLSRAVFDPVSILETEPVKDLFQRKFPGTRSWLFSDVFFMLEQLDILCKKYVDGPAGLSTLEICKLLFRATYPPELPEIDSRLRTLVEKELLDGQRQSIDESCSLCTGSALSCLALAGRQVSAEGPARWLQSLEGYRFAFHPDFYVSAPEEEHGLHYAASVLEGALDLDCPDLLSVEQVLKVFFTEGDTDRRGFPQQWVQWRNIDPFDVCCRVLSAIGRCLLAGVELNSGQQRCLRGIIENLVQQLCLEGEDSGTPAWRPYAARENLASLSLGLLLGVESAAPLASEIAGVFHRRAMSRGQRDFENTRLWDSTVDRCTTFIDGYFTYWETLLAAEERGVVIDSWLPNPEAAVGSKPG